MAQAYAPEPGKDPTLTANLISKGQELLKQLQQLKSNPGEYNKLQLEATQNYFALQIFLPTVKSNTSLFQSDLSSVLSDRAGPWGANQDFYSRQSDVLPKLLSKLNPTEQLAFNHFLKGLKEKISASDLSNGLFKGHEEDYLKLLALVMVRNAQALSDLPKNPTEQQMKKFVDMTMATLNCATLLLNESNKQESSLMNKLGGAIQGNLLGTLLQNKGSGSQESIRSAVAESYESVQAYQEHMKGNSSRPLAFFEEKNKGNDFYS